MDFAGIPWDKILEVLGFSIGLLYLWWEYHADPRLWIASIVMPAISMWIYLHKGIYADFAINIYYLVIAVYGYIVWTRPGHKTGNCRDARPVSSSDDKEPQEKAARPITRTPRRVMAGCAAVFGLLWVALWAILNYLTDSTVPVADAFTTSLSIVAMWMLARKYLEQWLAWVAVDAACVCLYAYKGIPLYAVLYTAYTVIAFIGYRKWRRMMAAQQ